MFLFRILASVCLRACVRACVRVCVRCKLSPVVVPHCDPADENVGKCGPIKHNCRVGFVDALDVVNGDCTLHASLLMAHVFG